MTNTAPKVVPAVDVSLALITGGSRGLGRSMALALADRGIDTVITYQRNADEAQKVVAEVAKRGRTAKALQLDVGDVRSFGRFVETLAGELKSTWKRDRLDALVNNAGQALHGPLAKVTEAEVDAIFGTHFKGTLFLTQALSPLLADGGRVINVSSGLARFSYPGYGVYAAAKGAIEVLTRYMAVEFGPRGIAVNTLAPGAIETDFGGGHVRDNKALNAQIASQTALGRVGVPEDIGGAVAALLSPGMRWANGQRLEVAGGIHL